VDCGSPTTHVFGRSGILHGNGQWHCSFGAVDILDVSRKRAAAMRALATLTWETVCSVSAAESGGLGGVSWLLPLGQRTAPELSRNDVRRRV